MHLINSGPRWPLSAPRPIRPASRTSDADRRRCGRNHLRRVGRAPRTYSSHARDLARPAVSEPHDRHAVGRHQEHRRGRRVDRLDRRGRPVARRTDQRRRRSRPGGLRPGRFAADGHGRGGRPRLHRPDTFPRRPDAARPEGRGGGASSRDRRSRPGRALEAAAASILELATEHMVQAILDVTLSQGIDPARPPSSPAAERRASIAWRSVAPWLPHRLCAGDRRGAGGRRRADFRPDLAHHQAMRHTTSESFDFDGVNRGAERARSALSRLPGVDRAPAEIRSQSIGRPRRAIPIRPGRSRCRCARARFDEPRRRRAARCRFP